MGKGFLRVGFPAIWRRLALAAMLAGSLAACGPNATLMSEADEARIGAENHQKIIAEFGGVYDDEPALTAYVEQVMQRIAQASEKPEKTYRITLLDSPVVNAFALPGGYTYVTRGLLALANDEAELAGVIGHEIGHVTARHGARRQTTAVGTMVIGAVLGGLLESATGINRQVTSDLVNLGGNALLAGYSRGQEYEADRLGVDTLARAGYDAMAGADFLGAMGRYGTLMSDNGGRGGVDWFASHPNTQDRVARARERARLSQNPANTPLGRGREAHLAAINGMVFGTDVEQGRIKGRQYAHAGLRLSFAVPKGFRLVNAPDKVTAGHENGVQIIFNTDKRLDGESARQYVDDLAAETGNVIDRTALSIGGRAAMLAILRSNDHEMRLLVIPHDSGRFLRFAVHAPVNLGGNAGLTMQNLRRTISFLSKGQAAAIKPLRVRVQTVRAGDTIDRFIGRMQVNQRKKPLFLALNGLSETDRLAAGQKVKIIAE
ncbi:MAG: M48 family metalloprotease [Parvibaculales bacterium]